MKDIELTPRLRTIGDMVRKGVRVADVGTDHAFLPLYLIKNGIAKFAVASDINVGPLDNARNNIIEHDCQDLIKLVHCGGLDDVCEDEADDVIVAGMGGELISTIIDNAKWLRNANKHLILQPMSRANFLRKYLCDNGFEIVEECIACEGKRVYTVISAYYCGSPIEYDNVYLYVGKTLCNNGEEGKRYALNQAEVLRKAAEGMEKSSENFSKSVKLMTLSQKIVEQVEEMR